MCDDDLWGRIQRLGGGSLIIVNTRNSLEGAHIGVFKQRGNRCDSLVLHAPLHVLQRLRLLDDAKRVEVPNLVLVYTNLEDATGAEYADWTMAVEHVQFLRAGIDEIRDALRKDNFYAPMARYFSRD